MNPDDLQNDPILWARILWEANHRTRNAGQLADYIAARVNNPQLTRRTAMAVANRALAATRAADQMNDAVGGDRVARNDTGINPNLPAGAAYRTTGHVLLHNPATGENRRIPFQFDWANNPDAITLQRQAEAMVVIARGMGSEHYRPGQLDGFHQVGVEVHSFERRTQ